MRPGPLLLLTLLAACANAPEQPTPPPLAAAELNARATPLGQQVRAAQLCGVAISAPGQDRAARIEAAAVALHHRVDGIAARDAFLRGLAPPSFEPRRRGRDRTAWCAQQKLEAQRAAAWLETAEAEEFAQRAEATP